MSFRIGLAALMFSLAPAAVLAESSIVVFTGRSIEGHVWQSDSLPLIAESGDQRQIGFGIADTPYDLPWSLSLGWEAGATLRLDGDDYGPSGTSLELWMGPTLRHDGFSLGPIDVRPSLTVGFSAVTGTDGLERAREIEEPGNAGFLYFMAPEFAFGTPNPDLDLVYRVQHRSGGKNVGLPPFGNLGDTTNANVFGLRWRF